MNRIQSIACYMVGPDNPSNPVSEPLNEYLSEETIGDLNYRQTVQYAAVSEDFAIWMRSFGKSPDRNIGLSPETVDNYMRRFVQLSKIAWSDNGFSAVISRESADKIILKLKEDKITMSNGDNYSESSKRKFADTLKKYMLYREKKYGAKSWNPPFEFRDQSPENAADPLLIDERSKIYNASLEYRSPPSYHNLTPEERSRWTAHVAQIVGKPAEKVGPKDFEKLQRSWKIPSLVGCALDGGLRPVEINRASINWVRLDKGTLQIPPESAAKNRKNWEVVLRDRTVKALDAWLTQRENISKYDGSDEIWLNNKSNPYDSKNLNYLLNNLLDHTDIDTEGRNIVWYSIRKSTGEYVHSKSDDITTASVLRCSLQNVENYVGPSPEKIRDILERLEGGN